MKLLHVKKLQRHDTQTVVENSCVITASCEASSPEFKKYFPKREKEKILVEG